MTEHTVIRYADDSYDIEDSNGFTVATVTATGGIKNAFLDQRAKIIAESIARHIKDGEPLRLKVPVVG